MSVVDQPILDATEETDKDRLWHLVHPSDPTRHWCGATKDHPGTRHTNDLSEIGCVVCVDLFLVYGMDGWLRGEGT